MAISLSLNKNADVHISQNLKLLVKASCDVSVIEKNWQNYAD